MRKCLFSLGSVLFIFFATAQTPVAYYPFSGNANDAAGSNHGTVNGGASLTTDRFGNANKAYSFDGVDDAISFTAVPMTNIDNFTLMAWVNPALFDPLNQFNKMIISLGPGNNGYNMGMGNNSGGGTGNQLGGLYNLVSWLPSGTFFNTINTWYHVAMVRQNGVTKFYLNAVQAPNTFTATPNAFTTAFQIGGQDFGPTHYWNGKIDEVKIYDVALTALQIQQDFVSSSQIQKPGSGNAISFDGVDDNVSMATAGYTNIQTYTIECWLKKSAANLTSHIWESNALSSPSLESNGNNNFNFFVGGSNLISTGNLAVGKWYHIACVYDKVNTLQQLYVNGVLMGSNTVNVSDVLGTNIGFGERLFGTPNNRFFNGELDEVRIWNTALTQTQIRDRMCRKITSSDALYSNLVAYYNFDESTGNTAFDGTANNNNGTLTNAPARVTSAAAIGTASAHDYVNATKTVSIAHASGESFTVTSASGNPDGIQVYRVDEQPNTVAGATGVGTNNKYFGVFQINGAAPQYTAVYNYTGNNGVTPANEFELRLNKRSDNAASNWTMLLTAPDETANTITVTGESTEYILGKLGAPLPLRLLSFSAYKQNDDALLQWKTAGEINLSRFEVQRSDDGVHFKTFATVPAGRTDYTTTDAGVFGAKAVVFYRLKSIDDNGRFVYSNAIKLNSNPMETLSVFPNPVQGVVSISGLKQKGVLKLYNADGKLLQQQTVSAQSVLINMSNYAGGIYLLQYVENGISVNQKIVKQ